MSWLVAALLSQLFFHSKSCLLFFGVWSFCHKAEALSMTHSRRAARVCWCVESLGDRDTSDMGGSSTLDRDKTHIRSNDDLRSNDDASGCLPPGVSCETSDSTKQIPPDSHRAGREVSPFS